MNAERVETSYTAICCAPESDSSRAPTTSGAFLAALVEASGADSSVATEQTERSRSRAARTR